MNLRRSSTRVVCLPRNHDGAAAYASVFRVPSNTLLGSMGVQRPRIAIVGAGFGGLELAKSLKRMPVDVVLIDQNNYHTFQPLLYQVATAALETDEIAKTVRGILRSQKNFSFRLGRVEGVDWERRTVVLADGGEVSYDYLVIAAGAATNTFGVAGVARHAFELKSLDDSVRLRNHVIRQFEEVAATNVSGGSGSAPAEVGGSDPRLTFVVVGGGPTGVETAGALRELFQHVLRRDFPRIDIGRTRVVLVEATGDLLGPFDERLRKYAARQLERRGVEVLLDCLVQRVDALAVELRDAEGRTTSIPSATVVWSAGVRANGLADVLGVDQDRSGRILVDDTLRIPGKPRAFALGDIAALADEAGEPHPQLAPVAIQGARHVAAEIRRELAREPSRAFRYKDKGTMATIGRGAAVAQLPSGLKLRGWLAWAAWALIHLTQIVGMRNKVYVYLNWVYNYLTYDRSARLILDLPDDAPASTVDTATPKPRLDNKGFVTA